MTLQLGCVWHCSWDGYDIAFEMDMTFQLGWICHCSSDGYDIAVWMGLTLQLDGHSNAAAMGMTLQLELVCDCRVGMAHTLWTYRDIII